MASRTKQEVSTVISSDWTAMLRARHASRDLSGLGDTLGIESAGGYCAGKPRYSSSGKRLAGIYRESFWQATEVAGLGNGFSGAVAFFVDAVEANIDCVKENFGVDLSWEIYVQHHSYRNHGGTFPARLLARMGALSIDLDVEVFPRK